MIYLDGLKTYVEGITNKCVVSVTPTYEVIDGGIYNTKMVEVYHLGSEEEATNLINVAKESNDFFSVMKKYKQPKYTKEGELLKEGYYIVKITYAHDYKEGEQK